MFSVGMDDLGLFDVWPIRRFSGYILNGNSSFPDHVFFVVILGFVSVVFGSSL